MHKMGWAASVVHADAAVRRRRAEERPTTPAEVAATFADYVATRPVLSLDKAELRAFAETRLGRVLTTSAESAFLDKLFDKHLDTRLDALLELAAHPAPPGPAAAAPAVAVARFHAHVHDLEKAEPRALLDAATETARRGPTGAAEPAEATAACAFY